MYDSLFRMYEGRNINRKMNLRAQLKGTKMSKGESIQDYITRVSQFGEQLSAIGVNPWTWVTLFGKRIWEKPKKHTSTEVLLSPRPRF